jgi:APA family basic amino acid/polyamine antiporter
MAEKLFTPEKQLKKSLSFIDGLAIVVGAIIGSGIFLKPGIVLGNAGSPFLGLMAWLVGGIVTLASALTIAEVGSAIPRTGGVYVYLEELFGDIWGFLFGWVQTVITYPASAAALAIAFATFSTFFIPMTGMQQKMLAIGTVIFLVIMNMIATKLGGVIQTVTTFAKLLPIVVIVAWGMLKGTAHDFGFISTAHASVGIGTGFGVAILGTLWAYDGWMEATNIAGELKNPAKQLPKALVIGVSTVVVVYMLVNIALLNVMPYSAVVASKNPASDLAVILFGTGAGAFIIAGIMVSVFGAENAYVMTGARIPLAMGERKQLPFPKVWADVHPKFKTPVNALLLECGITIIYILTGTFNTLTDILIFVLWIFFIMGVYSIFILRKHSSKYKATYKVPLYPFVPIVGILGGVYIVFSTVVEQPINALVGIAITLVGLPVFYYLKKK